MRFKVGDRVVVRQGEIFSTKRSCADHLLGTVIGVSIAGSILVEFDDFIRGHDGNTCCASLSSGHYGKDGHCWYCHEDVLHLEIEEIKESDLRELLGGVCN